MKGIERLKEILFIINLRRIRNVVGITQEELVDRMNKRKKY